MHLHGIPARSTVWDAHSPFRWSAAALASGLWWVENVVCRLEWCVTASGCQHKDVSAPGELIKIPITHLIIESTRDGVIRGLAGVRLWTNRPIKITSKYMYTWIGTDGLFQRQILFIGSSYFCICVHVCLNSNVNMGDEITDSIRQHYFKKTVLRIQPFHPIMQQENPFSHLRDMNFDHQSFQQKSWSMLKFLV